MSVVEVPRISGNDDGDISAVNAGTGLTGGGTSGSVTINLDVPVSIANGGTGQTSAANAINALLPTQTSHAGEFLTTDGSVASWAAAGGTSANRKLSNLDAPIAINEDLLFDADLTYSIASQAASLNNVWSNFYNGTSDTTPGSLEFSSVGVVNLYSSDRASSTSRAVNVHTGAGLSGNSGILTLSTGVATGASGNIEIATGVPDTAQSGSLTMRSADAAGSGAPSGDINIFTGGTADGNSGSINITSGSSSAAEASDITITGGTGLTGGADVNITSGGTTSGNDGNINLVAPGNGHIVFVDGTEGVAGYNWVSVDTSGKGNWSAPGNFPLSTKTGNYTITSADSTIIADSSGGAFNLTLPTPSTVTGRIFRIVDKTGTVGTNNVTLVRAGSEKIAGLTASRALQANWGFYTVVSDGTDWYLG